MGSHPSILDNSHFKYISNYSPSKFSSSISQEKTHYIILSCNAEFQNIINDQNKKELSPLGKEQAMDTGFQIKLNLLGIPFSEINIFTSPDITNIQTALYMANIIDCYDVSNKFLYINKNLASIYSLDIDCNSTQNFLSKEKYKNIIMELCKGKKYYFSNKDFNEMKNIINKEQTQDDINKRFNEITELIYKYIIDKYSNTNNNSISIICTTKDRLNHILSKLISIMNFTEDNKVNIELNKEIDFNTSYCFQISFSPEKKYSYLGKLLPNVIDINKNINTNKKINNRFIAIMRHGERIDSTNFKKNQESPKNDPELTYEGIKQALNIGIQLSNYLKEEKFEINEINIFNSPSLRTLQTGILAGGAADYSDKIEKTIRIITDLNETSVEGGFENNKEESPIYYHKDKDKHLKSVYDKYITKLIKDRNYRYGRLDFSSILGKKSFEDGETMKKRAENVINNIREFSKTGYNQGENTLNIISTHQLNVAMIVEYLIQELNKKLKEKGLNEIKIVDQSFGYCHCYLFKYDENDEFSFVGLFKPDIYGCFQHNTIKFN